MAHFILICRDGEYGRERRKAARPAHLDYIAQTGDRVKIAGPLMDGAGTPAGSLFLLDLPDRDAVEAFADADPYHREGVFDSREIRPFKLVIDTMSA